VGTVDIITVAIDKETLQGSLIYLNIRDLIIVIFVNLLLTKYLQSILTLKFCSNR